MKVSTGAVEATEVDIRPINSELVSKEEVFGSLEQKNVDYSVERKKSLRARYSYGIIFLVTNLIAWFVRDYGERLLPQQHYLRACGTGGRDCFQTLGVLRVSLGCFIFFFIMFLTTSKTRKLFEARNTWHSRWWASKFFLFIVSIAVPFFFSSDFIQLYGEFARIGAGIFLLLQLISVIQFINWWNSYWMPDKEMKQSCSLGLFMSTVFYIASICGIVLMYPFYAQRPSCTLNIFFITWTAILLIVMMAVSLHSKVNRGLLSSGIMASYVVFLCWSAIRSEPATAECNTKKQVNVNGDWTTILSFLMAICAIVMATFSTGIDSQSFQLPEDKCEMSGMSLGQSSHSLRVSIIAIMLICQDTMRIIGSFQFHKDEVQQEDDIPYKYGFFHLVFAFGAMYFAMLFISWNLNDSARKTIRWSIDVGWASTWVKIVNEWFAATIYIWTLISPIVIQKKVRDHDEPVQQTDDSALP